VSNQYKSRKHQIDAFMRRLVADCKGKCTLPRGVKVLIKRALRDAAIVGAREERSRTIAILGCSHPGTAKETITSRSVLSVLGFEEED
jgi:hypothetical protein